MTGLPPFASMGFGGIAAFDLAIRTLPEHENTKHSPALATDRTYLHLSLSEFGFRGPLHAILRPRQDRQAMIGLRSSARSHFMGVRDGPELGAFAVNLAACI